MTAQGDPARPQIRTRPGPPRVLLLGATGTIGRAAAKALAARGCAVVCFQRPTSAAGGSKAALPGQGALPGVEVRFGDVFSPRSVAEDAFCGEAFDAVISCMASRTGAPKDAWAVDHQAHLTVLEAAKAAGVGQFILLSAICVQKPLLEFQRAKLAFEAALMASGLTYSIIRPTAFFKSLSGQIQRVKDGKPFLLFGDGALTACKPISDEDLGVYIAECLVDENRRNRILPIGGPGPAITPKEQGERLFALLGRTPRFQSVPLVALDVVIAVLAGLGRVVPALAAKAELARIGRYYATQSMLVLNPETGEYDADATPSTGVRTLFDYYAEVIEGAAPADLGDHAVFNPA